MDGALPMHASSVAVAVPIPCFWPTPEAEAVEIDAGRKCTTYVLLSTRVAANCTAAPEISSESPSHSALPPSGHRGASEIKARSAASVLSNVLDGAVENNGALEVGALPMGPNNKDIHGTMSIGVVYVHVRWYGNDSRNIEVCVERGVFGGR